jgi:hypothetical protein
MDPKTELVLSGVMALVLEPCFAGTRCEQYASEAQILDALEGVLPRETVRRILKAELAPHVTMNVWKGDGLRCWVSKRGHLTYAFARNLAPNWRLIGEEAGQGWLRYADKYSRPEIEATYDWYASRGGGWGKGFQSVYLVRVDDAGNEIERIPMPEGRITSAPE